MESSNVDWKPRLGMEFDNRDKAYQFYLAYSSRVGFGVRKRNANKKKDGCISSCRLVCCKEGVRNKEKKDAHQGKSIFLHVIFSYFYFTCNFFLFIFYIITLGYGRWSFLFRASNFRVPAST